MKLRTFAAHVLVASALVALPSACHRSDAATTANGSDAGGERLEGDGAADAATARSASGNSSAPQRWQGPYQSEAATVYVPPDWKGVRWAVPDSSDGLGEGTLTLALDPGSHRVTGTVEGPIGPATVDGTMAEGVVTATIVRKDPSDRGFAGTLVASVEGPKLSGTMHVAAAEANAVRAVSFTLAPSP